MITRRRTTNTETATLWTLSGLVLAACGGGSKGDAPFLGGPTPRFNTQASNIETPMVNFMGNGMMDFHAPMHGALRGREQYNFNAMSVSQMSTIENVPDSAQGAEGHHNLMIQPGNWIRLIGTGLGPNNGGWNGVERNFIQGIQPDGRLSLVDLRVKLVDDHGIDTTVPNWSDSVRLDQLHGVYAVSDVRRDGDYIGRIEMFSVITPLASTEEAGDVAFQVTWDSNGNGQYDERTVMVVNEGLPNQMEVVSGDASGQVVYLGNDEFNIETFRRGDPPFDDLGANNKALLAYVLGSALGNNFLANIPIPNNTGHSFHTEGDTIAVDYFAKATVDRSDYAVGPTGEAAYQAVVDRWEVKVIWWFIAHYDYAPDERPVGTGLRQNLFPDDLTRTIPSGMLYFDSGVYDDDTMNGGNGIPDMLEGTGTGLAMNQLTRFRPAQITGGEIDDYTNNGSSIESMNTFRPLTKGRYLVQVVTYDPENFEETVDYGLQSIHEIDVHDPNPTPDIIDAYTDFA